MSADVMGVVLALSRVQTDLRMLMAQPERYPSNGHFDAVVNLTTALEGQVQHWMHGTPRETLDRRQAERRDHERREHERREHLNREVA